MPPKGKRPRKVVEPTNIQSFFAGRRIRPDLFTFDATGNAIFKPSLDAHPTKQFPLQKFQSATAEEIESLYAARKVELDTTIAELEEAKDALRNALKQYKEAGEDIKDVIDANRKVQIMQKAITAIMSPMQAMSEYYSVEIRDVLLENQYEKRKVQQTVDVVKGHSILSHSALLVPVSGESEALGEQTEEYSIIFDDPDVISNPKELPLLGLYKPKPLSVLGANKKKNVYNGLLQAVLVELMKANPVKFTPVQIDQLIKAGTPGAVRRIAETFNLTVGDLKDDILAKVIDAAIDEWSDEDENFMDALEETGDKTIVYVAPKQKTKDDKLLSLFGTGLLPGKPSVNEKGELVATEANQENPTKWKGLNRWGSALQAARARWRDTNSGGNERQAQDLSKVAVDLAAKTQQQQEAARKGAIIAAKRAY